MTNGPIAFYCISEHFGGIERNIIRMMMNCKEIGIHTVLIAAKNSPFKKELKNKGVEIYETEPKEGRLGIKSVYRIKQFLVEKRVKLLFVSRPGEIFIGALIKILSGGKIKLAYYQQVGLNFEKNRILYSLLFYWVDSWITPVNYIRREALEHNWSKKKKIDFIPHFLNLEIFYNNQLLKENAREKLDLPVDKKIIGILGRHNPDKNQDFLIRAVNFLKLNKYNIHLVIMGGPKKEQEKVYSGFLRELMCECNLQDQIHFRKFSDDLVTFLRAIDVFIITTNGETCDISLIESMAAGTPVIAVQSEYNSEILEKGNLGLLYKENNMEDFSAKVIKLFSQKKLYNFLRDEGKRAAIENYDKKSNNHKFETQIRELLKNK
jgi:glycosyltransferase involved in cell wall biosynthesis